MTVQSTIEEPLLLSGRYSKEELETEVERLMDLVGIEPVSGWHTPTSWTEGEGRGSELVGPWR